MDVRIQNVTGTVNAVGGDTLLSPAVLERIVAAVLDALGEQKLREQRLRADTRVISGSHAEEGDAR
jgi:hypothetical protein